MAGTQPVLSLRRAQVLLQLDKCIGRGTFSRIWSATDLVEAGDSVAVKIEDTTQVPALLTRAVPTVAAGVGASKMGERRVAEAAALAARVSLESVWIGAVGSVDAPRAESWWQFDEYNYMCMQLLKSNLSEDRKQQDGLKYSVRYRALLGDG